MPLPYEQQFDFYVEILRKKYRKQQNTKENEDFILSSQTLLTGPNKTYNFLFFLSIFLECFSTKFAYKQLIIFKPEKIKGIGKVSDTKLNQMNVILNVISKNPEKIHLENENDRQKVTELFYSVVLYFNLNLNKEKLAEMFKNEKAFDYLFNKLISFKNLFQGLIIPKNEISKLLESCKSFNHILTFLSYLGKDVNEFLQFIHEKEEFIGNFIEEELNKMEENKENKDKKDNLIISLEDFVEPKKEDDLNKLLEIIGLINMYQSSNGKIIKYSPSVFEKYIEFNNETNLSNLIILKSVLDIIKDIEKKFECKYKIEKIIHENGIKFVQNGKLKNVELLEFIRMN